MRVGAGAAAFTPGHRHQSVLVNAIHKITTAATINNKHRRIRPRWWVTIVVR